MDQKKKVLEIYEKRIIDLSRRNRLLKFPKKARAIDISMTIEEFEQKFGPLQDLQIDFNHKDILAAEQKELDAKKIENNQVRLIEPSEEDDLKNEIVEPAWYPPAKPSGKKLITTLSALRLDTKRKFEEHGLHTLFITIGKVQWNEPQAGKGSSEVKKSFDFNAPLFLIPAIIEEKRNPKKTTVRTYEESGDIAVNKVLSLLLEKEFGTSKLIINDPITTSLSSIITNLKSQVSNIFSELQIPVTITDDIQIGQYTYYGQQIFEDIRSNEEKMLENEFLNALCSHGPLIQENLSIPIESTDDFLTVKNDFTVLPADTSQLEVIKRVVDGNSLNVQGPPGTGKSQTIVNVIANLIARNKSILLVCEKQVALEVVLNRLKEIGLDKLCLPLFKYNADKRVFAKSIIEDRNSIRRVLLTDQTGDLKYRESKIQSLKAYAKALGATADPLSKSAYWVHGEIAKYLKDKIVAKSWDGDSPLLISYENYRTTLNILNSLSPLLDSIRDNRNRIWHIVDNERYSPDLFSRVKNDLEVINSELQGILLQKPIGTDFENLLGVSNYLRFEMELKQIPELPKYVLADIKISELHTFVEKLIALIKKYDKKAKSHTFSYKLPEAWDVKSIQKLPDFIESDFKMSKLEDLTLTLKDICSNQDHVIDILCQINKDVVTSNISLLELFINKNLLTLSSNVSLLRGWNSLDSLEEMSPILQNLSKINTELGTIKKSLHAWGITDQVIDHPETLTLCNKIIEKYNIFNTIFSSEYKNDRRKLQDLCNAKTPSSPGDVKKIATIILSINDKRKKRDNLLASLNTQYTMKGLEILPEIIPEIAHGVSEITAYLDKTAQGKLPTIYELIINYDKHAEKDLLFSSLSTIESLYNKISKIAPELSERVKQNINKVKEYTLITYSKAQELLTLAQLTLKALIVDDKPQDIQSILKCTLEINDLAKISDEFAEINVSKYLDNANSFIEYTKNLEKLESLFSSVKKIQSLETLYGTSLKKPITIDLLRRLRSENTTEFSKSFDLIGQSTTSMDKLLHTQVPFMEVWQDNQIKDLLSIVKEMASGENALASWMQYKKYRRQLSSLGLEWFATKTIESTKENNLEGIFAVTLWNAWLDAYYRDNEALQNFSLHDHETIIKEFRELDEKSRKINALRTIQWAALAINNSKFQYTDSERELIHQSELKRRHKPIRKIVNEIGNQILQYKRCWMMSPLTLSSYIPFGTVEFDTVIFDEASQMRVEHSLGAIARAKQVIIFGDEQQLPPTSFFDVTDDDEDSEEEDFESILHATKEILPGADRLLSYHYRSKYEQLIAYSNHYIYKDELITYPNPDHSANPIRFIYLAKGVFDGGKEGSRKNYEEADTVAKLCIEHVHQNPKKSLGVIAFSRSQEIAIRDSLIKELEQHPECIEYLNEDSDVLERFFIKNLESVQGDERDTIILSIGYGRDKQGNMYQRFGPINSAQGYRRLNVAVTRAKEEILCVSSIKSTDIRGEGGSRGVQLLQKYLEFAEFGVQSLQASKIAQIQGDIELDSPFEGEVEKALQMSGFIVHRQVGVSGYKIDLAIVDPKNENKYILGIECDGASYHSSYSARMNDKIRQENLERLGWKIYRVWSQHWVTHSEEIIADIKNVVADNL